MMVGVIMMMMVVVVVVVVVMVSDTVQYLSHVSASSTIEHRVKVYRLPATNLAVFGYNLNLSELRMDTSGLNMFTMFVM
jgi:hypothetical protein